MWTIWDKENQSKNVEKEEKGKWKNKIKFDKRQKKVKEKLGKNWGKFA